MELKEYLDLVNNIGYIDSNSEAQKFMDEASYLARKMTNKINYENHTSRKLHDLLEELTNSKLDEKVKLFPPIYTDFGKNLHLGKGVFINSGCCFQDQGGIYIGDNTLIGHEVVFATINHDQNPLKRGSMTFKPIYVGKNVWIGAHVTILPGVNIGDGAIIGAGAVVNKDIPINAVAVGVPAKVIKFIKEGEN